MSLDDYYKTTDLALAALLSLFFTDYRLERLENKVVFVFERTKELEATISEYFSGRRLVEPKTYFDQIRFLKARIYAND